MKILPSSTLQIKIILLVNILIFFNLKVSYVYIDKCAKVLLQINSNTTFDENSP